MKKMMAESRLLALLDQVTVSGGNFFSLLYLGRHLAAGEFGPFSLAIMSLLFFANLHRAMFTQPLNIFGATDDAQQRVERMAALLRTQLLAIPVAIALLAPLSLHFFPHAALLFGCACYIAGYFLQDITRRYWHTAGRLECALRSDLISYGGQLALLFVAGSIGALDTGGGAIALMLMASASMLAFLVDLRALALPRAVFFAPASGVLIQHWRLARWLLPTVVAVWAASQAFPFLIASLGPLAVASFAACRNLLNVVGVVGQSIGNCLPTRAAALLHHEGKQAFRNHLMHTLARTAALGMGFLLPLLLAAELVLHLAYGGSYDSAARTMRILALAAFLSLLGAVLGAYSLAMEDSRASFLSNLGAGCVTFTLGLWLIWAAGVDGAAMAAVLSAATSMTLQGSLVLRRLKRLPIQDRAPDARPAAALL